MVEPKLVSRFAWVLLVLGGLALASLVIEYGMPLPQRALGILRAFQVTVAAVFVLEPAIAFVRSRSKGRFLHEHWIEAVLLAGLVLSLAAIGIAAEEGRGSEVSAFFHVRSLPRLCLILLQVYLLVGVLARTLRAHELLLDRHLPPEALLIGGFAALTLLGTLLLMLPRAAVERPLSLVDALFTSTSAVCVTGLAVRDTGSELSGIGQAVLVFLFQIGGLGIVTFVSFGSILSGRRLSVPHMVAVRTLVSAPTMADVRRQVTALVAFALTIEACGALVLYWAAPAEGLAAGRVWWSIFHSISAFCNAGFGLESDSLASLRGAVGVNVTIMSLLVLGGLGAPVLRELVRVGRAHLARLRHPRRRHAFIVPIRLQARLALIPTLVLLPLGALGFLALEFNGVLRDLGFGNALLASCFQSATTRTAGFATVDFGSLGDPTLLLLTGFMAIGASPVSTGGGIKTATVMVLLLALRAMARGRDEVEYGGRTIARTAVRAALSVTIVYLFSCMAGVFALSLTDAAIPLRDRIFEVVSALSTVGLSTGVTAEFGTSGKLVLCALMFMGRVGPLSLALIVFRPRGTAAQYQYPSEPVLLG